MSGVERILDLLVERAAELTGYRRDAIQRESLRRLVASERARGVSPEALLAASASASDPVASSIRVAVSVGETFFFRHAAQLTSAVAAASARAAREGRPVRAWSAGCSTGEEAYSLAMLLSSAAPEGAPLPVVLGTDRISRALDVAREGRYRPWSVRSSSPAPWLASAAAQDGTVQMPARLRALVRFEKHDLLSDALPEEEPFDLVLCRNVLVYLTAENVTRVRLLLQRAVHPDGLLLFGPMDLLERPPELEAVGDPEMQTFRLRARATETAARPVEPSPPPPPVAPVPVERTRPDPAPGSRRAITLHYQLLQTLERGDLAGAGREMDLLANVAPDYLPGVLERALFADREGDAARARRLMQQLLDTAQTLAPDAPVEGPETLPARFYVASAEAYLAREPGLAA